MNATDNPAIWLPDLNMTPEQAAVAYASHGFRVIPVWGVVRAQSGEYHCACNNPKCSAGGKHPIGKCWQKLATGNVDEIRELVRPHPKCNLGLVMGGDSRLVAVDIDGAVGRESWSTIERAHDIAPLTLTNRSGRADGGEHRIYRIPEWLDVERLGNRSGVNGLRGLDVRTANGQVVVCPSTHLSGARYEWAVRVPVADMPEWLFEALAKKRHSDPAPRESPPPPPAPPMGTHAYRATRNYVQRVTDNAVAAVASSAEGERNDVLFRRATTCFEYHFGEGIDTESASAALRAAALQAGLDSGEVHKTLASALATAQKNPKRVPPLAEAARPVTGRPHPANPETPEATVDDLPGAASSRDWKQRLTWKETKTGHALEKTIANVVTILQRHPDWAGRVRLDTFARRIAVMSPPWHEDDAASEASDRENWTDTDDVRLQCWLQRTLRLDMPVSLVSQAVNVAADRSPFHPVCDYLRSLTWDQTPRLDAWLVSYLGAQDTAHARAVGRRWLVSAVARVEQPGCKADVMLVLEGAQGTRKSSALRVLAGPEWFTDEVCALTGRDADMGLQGKLVVELGELAALFRSDAADAKTFISRMVDRFREPYGRRVKEFPRQCVFAGTVNHGDYLKDPTGGRRYWPVKTGAVDLDALVRDRDQLWAEAFHTFRSGAPWWLETEELTRAAEEEQEARRLEDAWEEKISRFLGGRQETSMLEIVTLGLNIEVGRATPADHKRVAAILHRLGLRRVRRRTPTGQAWLYRMDHDNASGFSGFSGRTDGP